MASFPQSGRCLCGEVEYRLEEAPLAVYACHCTDCQTQTGSSFKLCMVARADALRVVRGEPREHRLRLADGRAKDGHRCERCGTRLWSPSGSPQLRVLEAGTLDDTAWLRPAAHIWTRSRQPWVALPGDELQFEVQPRPDEWSEVIRAWKERSEA